MIGCVFQKERFGNDREIVLEGNKIKNKIISQEILLLIKMRDDDDSSDREVYIVIRGRGKLGFSDQIFFDVSIFFVDMYIFCFQWLEVVKFCFQVYFKGLFFIKIYVFYSYVFRELLVILVN